MHSQQRHYGPELHCFYRAPDITCRSLCNAKQSDFSTTITSLHWSQTSHLSFCACKTTTLWPELLVSMGPRPHLSFCACKTAWLAPELLVSMGPRPHLSFCACKKKRMISIRMTSLYGSQPSFVVFACKTATLASELQVSMGPRIHLLICACKTACLDPEWLVYWSQHFIVAFVSKTVTLATELLVSTASQTSFMDFAFKNRDFRHQNWQVSMGPRSHLTFCA